MAKANEILYKTTRSAVPKMPAPEPPPLDAMWKTLTFRQLKALAGRIGRDETIRFVKKMQEIENGLPTD